MNPHQVILSPVQSEKAYAGLESNRYSFKVHPDATKGQIKAAVQTVFNVKVVSVSTSTTKAKPKRRGWTKGTRSGYKKAVVRLSSGDSIQMFEGVH